ncbi:hypothetical protein MNV49_003971 [Pseudohyphozyma bogoriensis]|nr:hypothetical protein MNV49_003971 [Pseudohyphozyma bogoriensis]
MLLCVRASDGAGFHLSPDDFKGIQTLDQLRTLLLTPLLEIPPDCLICMNEEGVQLRDESVSVLAMLASSPTASMTREGAGGLKRGGASTTSLAKAGSAEFQRERRLYVFDREHLDADPNAVADALAITEDQVLTEPELSRKLLRKIVYVEEFAHPVGPPAQDPLQSHIALSHHNLDTLRALIHSISLQRASLELALSNLTRVMTGTSSSLTLFAESSATSFESWDKLLEGWEGYMEAIAKVQVVAGLLGKSGHNRESSITSSTGKEKERVLGDYVSRDKMLAVKEGCARVLAIVEEVLQGTAQVREDFDNTSRDLEDLDVCESDAFQGHLRIEELVNSSEGITDPELQTHSRDRIRFLVERKNAMTRYLIMAMQRISNLQSDVAAMPSNLGALDHDMKIKTDNFKHLARLEGLIPAYIGTVVERDLISYNPAQLLVEYCTGLSNSIRPLDSTETSRRTRYRSNYSGKLPWEVRGLAAGTDELVPAIELELRNSVDDLPDLKRDVLEGLQKLFEELDAASSNQEESSPLKAGRSMLADFIKELDALEKDFAVVISGNGSPSPPPDPSAPTVDDLEKQLRALEDSKVEIERQLQAERSTREEELAQINQKNAILAADKERDDEKYLTTLTSLRAQITAFEKEKAEVVLERKKWERERGDWEKERGQSKELLDEVVKRAGDTSTQLKETSAVLEETERQLTEARTSAEDLKSELGLVQGQHTSLRSDHDNAQWELSRIRATVADLEHQVHAAEAAQRDASSAIAEKERLLKEQRTESELDRALLEKEVKDLNRALASKNGEIALTNGRCSTLEDVASGLRDQISRWEVQSAKKENEVGVAKSEAEMARKEREQGIVEVQRELVQTTKVAREALKLAGTLRDDNLKLTNVLLAPAPTKSDSSSDNPEKTTLSSSVAEPVPDPVALDYAERDLDELLAEVSKYDPDALNEAVKAKVESLTSLTKKWTKEAKAYRERAHRATAGANDKIAFRNFAKGDLALFLPTRNSTVPVWAAFNVSFPHHFLAATTPTIREQMKTREWIVARITSLTETVVDVKPGPLSASTVVVDSIPSPAPDFRRSASTPGLPSNATDLARSEFAIVGNIVEEDETSRPASPASPSTLRQPVPSAADQPAYDSPPQTPSALALSLAKSPPTPQEPALSTPPTQARSDPFASGPFVGEGTSPVRSSPVQSSVPSPRSGADFQPANAPDGDAPAFLPSNKSSSSNGGSVAGSRYGRRLSASMSTAHPRNHKASAELGTSPISTSGSYMGMPRSASSASGSSILSASIHRRVGSSFMGTSPPAKAVATQESQDAGSRWKTLQEDLATATRDELRPSLARQVPKQTMTVGRSTKGWAGKGDAGGGGKGVMHRSGMSSASFLETVRRPPPTMGLATSPTQTGTGAASEILKRLKPANGAGGK